MIPKEYQVKTTWKDWNECMRTKCLVYTRCMGYYRPVELFNIGKKAEFYSRTNFDYDQSMNSKFINDYKN